MSEALVPVTAYDTPDLADSLRELVHNNRGLLLQRHIVGPIVRYGGSPQLTSSSVERLKRSCDKGTLEAFAIVVQPHETAIRGMATIYPNLELGKMRLPLPAGIPKHPRYGHYVDWMRVTYPYAMHNVQAWTDGLAEEMHAPGWPPGALLARAYRDLVSYADEGNSHSMGRTWTIEPARSPAYVHGAIANSGLTEIAEGRFEDNEVNTRIPPRSILYANTDVRGLRYAEN